MYSKYITIYIRKHIEHIFLNKDANNNLKNYISNGKDLLKM